MFGCIYQLWDWLEAPPLFTPATMDAKKLQQLQQQAINAQQQKKIPLAYQTNIADYRTATHSPVFQQQQQNYHMQQQSMLGGYQQSPTATSSSGGPLTPIDMQPQANKLLLKHNIGGNTSSSSHSSPYHQSSSAYTSGEQLYQSPNERTYLAAAGRLQATNPNPVSALHHQYQQLQHAKMQAQMATQSEAVQQQQRTFAMRQALNPPVPQGHYHMSQSSSIMSTVTLQQQQLQQQAAAQQQNAAAAAAQHQRAPPSTLNLASQFQPAAGPLKVNQQKSQQQQAQHYHQQQEQQIYVQQQLQLQLQLQHQQQLQQQHHQQQQQQQQQHQQQPQSQPHPQQQQQQQHRLISDLQTPGSEHSPVYIQQNHPGHVVNQACQTQISAVKPGTAAAAAAPRTTPSSEDSSGKSPSHAPLDRKKSVGSMQALKSPITKRPPASPVTISGWLYKQGSEGLKVWRKRWFVLAEYCLYYYKGPEEEKLLGSILLPSYRVSACLPEDKIYRKYAFKCEHQNMRTYWLAAETGESMMNWVRALTAATMMQAPISGESDQPASASSSLNHSGENSDSGIHTLQSQQSKMSLNHGQVTPASDNGNAGGGGGGGNNSNTNAANSASSSNSGGAQPLYANAPPKPRRINDGGYSSPSPEHSIDSERKQQHHQQQQQQQSSRRTGIMSPTLQQMQQQQQYQQQQRSQQQPQQHHAIYDTRTGSVSSALRLQQQQQQYSVDNLEAQLQQQMALAGDDYGKSPPPGNYMDMEEQIMRLQQQPRSDEIYGERELYMQKLIQQRYPAHLAMYPNAERRTPDAYGRSKNRIFSDYEDIYNLTQAGIPTSAQEALLQEAASYRRPLSPPSYDGSKHVPAMPSRYTPNHLESASAASNATGSNSNLRARPAAAIMRPHSADFLEYEARAEAAAAAASASHTGSNAIKPDAIRAPRPKSSLDINRTPDSFYYSEASYAEKMRKSALYLQHPQSAATAAAASAQPQQAGGYRTAPAEFQSPVGSGMNTIGYENPYERTHKRKELRNEALGTQGGASSIPRMSRSNTSGNMTTGGHLRSTSSHHQSQQHMSSPQHQLATFFQPSMSTQQIIQQNEQFLRSASARLPKRSGGFDDDYGGGGGGAAVAASSPTGQLPGGGAGSGGGGGGPTHQDGERKREESMKRLLEWKQRMLQSPLTRKGISQSGSNMSAMSKLGSNPNILLASTTVASGAHYAPTGASAGTRVPGAVVPGNLVVGGVTGIQRSRSEIQANVAPAAYNSYSSDDEVGTDMNAPAGRSTTTTATNNKNSNTTTTCNMHATSTTTTTNIIAAGVNSNKCNTNSTTKPTTIAIVDTELQQQTSTDHLTKTPKTSKPATVTTRTKTTTNNDSNTNHNTTITTPTSTPFVLKPILKSSDTSSTVDMSTHTKIVGPKKKLQLNMAALKHNATSVSVEQYTSTASSSAIDEELPAEVPILPKKPAPKSPQITSYIPVYTTKTLTTGATLVKNYENIEIDIRVVDEETDAIVDDEQSDIAEVQTGTLTNIAANTHEAIAITDAEETPMLMNLKLFKETQEAAKQCLDSRLQTSTPINTPAEECIELDKSDELNSSHATILYNPGSDNDNDNNNEDDDNDEDTACEEYTDDDLDEALAEEADVEDGGDSEALPPSHSSTDFPNDSDCAKIYENEPRTPITIHHSHLDESHYLPMTPKKMDLGQSGSLTLVSYLQDSNTEEENPYVEMTKGLQDEDSKSNYEIMCISNAPVTSSSTSAMLKAKQLQIQAEPVYMELSAATGKPVVPAHIEEAAHSSSGKSTLKKNKKNSTDTLKKKCKKSSAERAQSKRKDLPDILKPSQSSTMTLDSDSSDADDESSKHVHDPKKMRSRTRFSLSDTFRPASYYLGASTPLTNCVESSDSEIVSPPPIPLSPPPMEELKTEEIFSSENYDTVKRRDSSSGSKFNLSYEQLPKMHASNTSLNLPKSTETALKSSRLSLPDQFSKVRGGSAIFPKATPHTPTLLKHHERTLSDSNYSFQTDNSSNTSSDFELYNKLKQNSPSFVATPVRYQSNSSLPQKYCSLNMPTTTTGDSSETDSVEFRHRQGSDSELERQRSRRPLSEESISEIESLSEKFEETLNTHDLDTYLSQLQNNELYLYQNTRFDASSSLINDVNAAAGANILTNLIKPPATFRNKDDEHFYGNIHFVSSTDSLQKLGDNREMRAAAAADATSLTPTFVEQEHLKFYTPLHSRNNSNISEQSAPYYYSELNSSREMLNTPTTLNNLRDVHSVTHSGGSSNIAHIHNPLEAARSHSSSGSGGIINVDILADKDQAIDSKNIYKMKTNIEKLSYRSGKILKAGGDSDIFPHAAIGSSTQAIAFRFPSQKLSNFQTNINTMQAHVSSELMSSPTMSAPSHLVSQPQHNSNLAFPYIPSGGGRMAQTSSPIDGANVERYAKNTNVQVGIMSGGGAGGINAELTTPETSQIQVQVTTQVAASTTSSDNNNSSNNNMKKLSVLGGGVAGAGAAPVTGGELLWEEDSLWRESLRRVSQRHARSLDDLDRIASPVALVATIKREREAAARSGVAKAATIAMDHQQQRLNKPKISRDVTYVNDNVSQQFRASYKPRSSESPNKITSQLSAAEEEEMLECAEMDQLNENDVYVQLLHDTMALDTADPNSDVYEVLREETGSNLSHTQSAEIDRENIRQWDSMSSGLMKNSSSSSNTNQESCIAITSSTSMPNTATNKTTTTTTVKSIIQQLNANCDTDGNSLNMATDATTTTATITQ